MDLVLRPEPYAVVRFPPATDLVDVLPRDGVVAIVRSESELSIWMPEDDVPDHGIVSAGWRLLMVDGPLDLALTGVLASLLVPLADAGVSVFPFASHDTDWIGIPQSKVEIALAALQTAGHQVAAK